MSEKMVTSLKRSHPSMIRPDLRPPKRDQKMIDCLTLLAEQIVEAVDSRLPYATLIAEFNSSTQRNFTVGDFVGAASSMTMREFALGALIPEPHRVEGVTRDDLLEIIRRIRDDRGEGLLPDSELGYYVRFLAANIPNPRISDLLFHSDHLGTAEHVLAEAMRYHPHAMPAPRDSNERDHDA